MSRAELTRADTDILVRAIYAVFRAVAEADGTVDEHETASLRKMLSLGAESGDELFKSVLQQASDECESRITDVGQAGEDVEQILSGAADILEEKLDESDAQSFKVALVLMGRQIAEASGGGILGLSRKTSVEESVSLRSIETWLRVSIPE